MQFQSRSPPLPRLCCRNSSPPLQYGINERAGNVLVRVLSECDMWSTVIRLSTLKTVWAFSMRPVPHGTVIIITGFLSCLFFQAGWKGFILSPLKKEKEWISIAWWKGSFRICASAAKKCLVSFQWRAIFLFSCRSLSAPLLPCFLFSLPLSLPFFFSRLSLFFIFLVTQTHNDTFKTMAMVLTSKCLELYFLILWSIIVLREPILHSRA